MDIAGLALSAGSLAIQLGQVGVDLFNHRNVKSTSVEGLDGEALGIAAYHEYRQSSLLASILCKEQKFDVTKTLYDEMTASDQELCLAVLNQLLRIWVEYRSVQSKVNGVSTPTAAGNVNGGTAPGLNSALAIDRMRLIVLGQDRDRLRSLTESASQWNSRLERTLSNFTWSRSLDVKSLEETVKRLQLVAADPDAGALGWTTPAKLREVTLAIGNPSIDRSSLDLPDLDIKGDIGSGLAGEGVSLTSLREGNSRPQKVVIEFLPYKRQDERHGEATLRRVEQLTALLYTPKSPDFLLPVALGYLRDSKRSRFGILFPLARITKHRNADVFTLQAVLQKTPASRPSLGTRLQLAYNLAQALSRFQSVGWVHQNLRSENILFFAESGTTDLVSDIPYSEPKIFGYGTSRLDLVPSANLYDDNPLRNIYRHPTRWGIPSARFGKLHDIYSLGVCLLEIGYWAPISTLVVKESTLPGADPSAVSKELLSLSADSRVAESMGEVFAKVSELCLKSSAAAFGFREEDDDRNESTLQQRYQQLVIHPLKRAMEALLGVGS